MGKVSFRLKWSLQIVKCKIWNEVEGKDKMFIAKWDSFC
jgi:hypothetical protein